jgi:hypothetical protein
VRHCSQHGSIIASDHGINSTPLKPTTFHYFICPRKNWHAIAGDMIPLSHLSTEVLHTTETNIISLLHLSKEELARHCRRHDSIIASLHGSTARH